MNKLFVYAALAALILPSMAACSSHGKEESVAYTAPDMFTQPVDPSDSEMKAAIDQFLIDHNAPKNSQYEYTRMDLNGDGLREALILFNLPHSYWCGWSGCTMAVFQAGDRNFSLLSETTRIRGPLMVGSTRTNGWDDIGVRLSGTDMADRNVLLKFDGMQYPSNPLNESEIPYDLASLGGTRVFP